MNVRWPLPVLHEDELVLAVDKPAGLLSVPPTGRSARNAADLVRRAAAQLGRFARPAHRLDRDTSGVLLFALDPEALRRLEQSFRKREVEKIYLALVHGAMDRREGVLRSFLIDLGDRAKVVARPGGRAREAVTRFRVIERFALATLVEARPVTGRLNQIRVQFSSIGHPLVGERKYARGSRFALRHRRPLLHAQSIALAHPSGAGRLRVRSPLPEDFARALERLRRS